MDLAKALVEHLWPNEPDHEKQRMVDAIMGKTISRVKCASDVIAAVKELGQEGERDFSYIHQVALNQEAVEKERKLRSPGEEHEEKKTFTPGTLKSLLPPAPQAMANRNPILKRYQAFYPGFSEKT